MYLPCLGPRLAVKAMSTKFCARVEVREGLLRIFLLDTPIAGIIFMMSEMIMFVPE